MTDKNLHDELYLTVKEIIEKSRRFELSVTLAFFGAVALELWALNLMAVPDEVADELLDGFGAAAKKRSSELKEMAKEPKWHQ